MSQEVMVLKIEDLVLWTENPRDPIKVSARDQDIVDRALEDKSAKWGLTKLAKEMGDFYDFSELPTIVYHGKTPIVYDGNRRVILAKLKHNLVSFGDQESFNLPEVPIEIPCNVCSKDVALKNIYRKHIDSGSWQPLERDIFLNKFMKAEKSTFLVIEETTGLITANPHLNQRFVKEEILKEEILLGIGIDFSTGELKSVHSQNDVINILSDISNKIRDKKISTRNNRGKVIDVLDKSTQKLINKNKENDFHSLKVNFVELKNEEEKVPRLTRRSSKKEVEIFGGKLILVSGDTNSLYRDIDYLYDFYIKNKKTLSTSFPSLLRMALRLLCESAADVSASKDMGKYLKEHFANAKKNLDQDLKTTLANQNVNENTIAQLLHTGAHNYQSASNLDQTIAVSIIIGEILKITHGKK